MVRFGRQVPPGGEPVTTLPYPMVHAATAVDNAQDDAGMPLPVADLASVIEAAIRDAGYRLVPLRDLPSEAHARASDVAESHDAAASVTKLNEKHAAIRAAFLIYGAHGLTDEELADRYLRGTATAGTPGWPAQSLASLRTRRAELVAAGLVRATGETRPTRSGRKAQVWEAVPDDV